MRQTFQTRADLSEWMDEPCAYEDFRDCLRDLAKVNRLTFAHRPTLQWLGRLLRPGGASVHLVDVGCGGGDMLRHIEDWAEERQIAMRLTGIDLNPFAAQAAAEFTPATSGIHWITGDAFSYKPAAPVHLVISSLFTHHLADDQIVRFLRWMEDTSTRGWFINDLHREYLPFVGFSLLATVMRWHRFVLHDGPVSIRRAFRREDWSRYVTASGIPHSEVNLESFRPSRLCVSRIKA